MIKRTLLFLIVASLVSAGVFFVWMQSTLPRPGQLDVLQNGDLVFQTLKEPRSLAIIAATGSFHTHVGIIRQDQTSGPVVIEAADQVRETPLAQWVSQGFGSRVTVKRLRGMTPDMAARVLTAARAYYGKPYDPLYTFAADRIYAGELVMNAFQSGARTRIGRIQPVMELNFDNLVAQKFIAMFWQKHPSCQAPPTNNFTACTNLLLRQEVITPASIAQDPKLDTIYNNYGFLAR